ncbi:MAG TPA: hypothetical protein VN829_20970 [Dongiaceae bacterium]|nr:hypothetical protein [Dongiaceae bacterium]
MTPITNPPPGERDHHLHRKCRFLMGQFDVPGAVLFAHHRSGWLESGMSLSPNAAPWLREAMVLAAASFTKEPGRLEEIRQMPVVENEYCRQVAQGLDAKGAALLLIRFDRSGRLTLRVGICGDPGLDPLLPKVCAGIARMWGDVCGN